MNTNMHKCSWSYRTHFLITECNISVWFSSLPSQAKPELDYSCDLNHVCPYNIFDDETASQRLTQLITRCHGFLLCEMPVKLMKKYSTKHKSTQACYIMDYQSGRWNYLCRPCVTFSSFCSTMSERVPSRSSLRDGLGLRCCQSREEKKKSSVNILCKRKMSHMLHYNTIFTTLWIKNVTKRQIAASSLL